MTIRKAFALVILANAVWFAFIGTLLYWGATKLYDFAIYQHWIRP